MVAMSVAISRNVRPNNDRKLIATDGSTSILVTATLPRQRDSQSEDSAVGAIFMHRWLMDNIQSPVYCIFYE